MTPSFLPKNAFPLPSPLEPSLVTLGLDKKTAAALSKVYISSALTLKARCEAEYAHACSALLVASDERGYSSKELRSKLLTVAVVRYSEALTKWEKEARDRAEANLVQRPRKTIPQPKVKRACVPSPRHNHENTPALHPTKGNSNTAELGPLDVGRPTHAFPQPYPPPVRPAPVSFVTHLPPPEKGSRPKPQSTSNSDLNACIASLSRLSLGQAPQNRRSCKVAKVTPPIRSPKPAASGPTLTSKLRPSRPRLVLPTLDTSVAVSHKSLPKTVPPHLPANGVPRTQNVDIPRSSRRKMCSIPYRRPTIHPSTPSASPSSSPPCSLLRAPSLVSDHGSEASSPSTPPDFPSILVPTSTITCEGSLPEVMSLEQLLGTYPGFGRQDIGYEVDLISTVK